jgi:glycosyltransferase involved in cell wall biosynthesis
MWVPRRGGRFRQPCRVLSRPYVQISVSSRLSFYSLQAQWLAGGPGGGQSTVRGVVWLGVQPVPYNSFFLERLRSVPDLRVDVYYALPAWRGLPWRTRLVGPGDRFFRRSFGIDLGLLARAMGDRGSLFVIAGWEDLTKVLVILLRGILGRPFAVWTDTVSVEAGLNRRVRRRLLRVLLRRATAILATGEVGIQSVRQGGLAPEGVTLANFPFWVPLPDLSHRSYASRGTIRFLCAGRLVPRKGFDRVIEAFRIAVEGGDRKTLLRIAGTGPEESALRQRVAGYGLQQEIEFLGWVEPDQMELLRLESDVLIHVVPEPDPFPVAVLEAMACGMAIVGSREAGSVAERVEDGLNGLVVESTDFGALAGAISRLGRDVQEVERLGRNARRTAEAWPVDRGVGVILGLLADPVAT